MSEITPSRPVRPTGITILAVLAFVGGLFGLCGALLAFFAILGISTGLASALDASGIQVAGGFLAIVALLAAFLYVALMFAFAYGAWNLKPWAWILGIIAEAWSVITIISNLINGSSFSSQLFPLAIAVGILYYLFTPAVKKAFGRGD